MKLKKQRKVLEKAALFLFGYGGSAKRSKKLCKSVYKRLPARTVARILDETQGYYRVQRGIRKTLSYHRQYGVSVTDMWKDEVQPLSSLNVEVIHDSFREVH